MGWFDATEAQASTVIVDGSGCMSISGSSAAPLIRSLENSDGDMSVGVALLKKAQDQMKAEGAAVVKLIEQTPKPAAAPHSCSNCYGGFDVYA